MDGIIGLLLGMAMLLAALVAAPRPPRGVERLTPRHHLGFVLFVAAMLAGGVAFGGGLARLVG